MKKLTAKALSTQLSIVIIVGLLIISVYSILSTYNKHINASQEGVMKKLHSITTTLSASIDGDNHQFIIDKYSEKDEIKTVEQDSNYNEIHRLIRKVQLDNHIPTDIYTLFFSPNKENLSFGVASGESPYYRHEYKSYPQIIKDKYNEGGVIEPYADKHGTWLSAFSPIKNSDGEVVAIIQADIQFDSFIEEARKEMYFNILMSVIVFLLITGFVLYTVSKLAKLDAEKNEQLQTAFSELKIKNKDITDSINYALRIQTALVPKTEEIKAHLEDCFMFYEPKDVVSGDFPWFYKHNNYLYLAVVDCTGHGVPGAMMSIIGCLLLNDIVNNEDAIEPGKLLNTLHKSVVDTLKQYQDKGGVADGMDVSMCRIDLENNEVHYAGAHRPLYHISNGKLIQYKGCKYPVGGAQYKGKNHFENQVIKVQKGDGIYFFSDGLPDQFGGELNRKFGPRRIREILLEGKEFGELKETLYQAYLDWKGNTKQIDDILLIGVKF